MKQIIEYLEKIEQTQGTNAKEELLYEALIKTNLIEFLKLTYSNTNYGVSTRSFEKIVKYDGKESYFDAGELVFKNNDKDLDLWHQFSDMKIFLSQLETLSGNELLKYLKNIMLFNSYCAKWITRLILKDLKIGISLKTINKVLIKLGKPKIEKFEVQLCGKFNTIDDYNLGYPVLVSVKYDGMRCFLEKKGNKVTMTSRNGENIDYVPELTEYFKTLEDDFIFDGEIMAEDFSALSLRIGRKPENFEPVTYLHFRLFDLLKYNDNDFINLDQKTRTEALNCISDTAYLKKEESYIINNKEDLKEIYDKMVQRREEGIIIKLLDKPYEFDSRKNWFKIKPVYENTFKVIDFKKGTGRKAGLISSLLVEDKLGIIKSYVGAGLTDNDILILMNLEREGKLIGSLVDIAYNDITTDKHGSKSLRFPRFLKLRTDLKNADDMNA